MKKVKLFYVLSLLLVGCATRNIYQPVLVPAEINIPQHVQTIGVLNRSLPAKDDRLLNILEGFLSGETIFGDRSASFNACRGLVNRVNSSPRFKAVLLEGEEYRGTGTKEFPLPLTWDEVDRLCKKYNVDALVTLETFDSDMRLHLSMEEVEKVVGGVIRKVPVHYADLRVRVNAGWRIYDNVTKNIIDQQVFTDEKGFHGEGDTPEKAKESLPSKRQVLDESGFFAGQMMAFRISPSWVTISRFYYVKGHPKFKEAKQYVKVGNWKEAVSIWSQLTKSSNPKIASRAAHNMAVAAEKEGRIDIALDWANTAYKNQKTDRERRYINQLHNRKMQLQRLSEQLPNYKQGGN
ncbi:MAG: DUF6340 family protein [Bacteroidales bacterium]|nr:DUF6340 family protein [Bacteroidales bacterium]